MNDFTAAELKNAHHAILSLRNRHRKILISPDTPCIISIMRLIETQSKTTLGDLR
jgi:hypothetical protein